MISVKAARPFRKNPEAAAIGRPVGDASLPVFLFPWPVQYWNVGLGDPALDVPDLNLCKAGASLLKGQGVNTRMDLSGKQVLITGGGGGLGRVLAADFASAGADVHIAGRSRAPLDHAMASIPHITAHQLDVTDEATTDALFAGIGACDIVIANAGIAESAPLHRTSLDQWQRIIAVNLTGCFLTFRAGLRALRDSDSGWGRLIAISSIMGLAGYRYASAYSASKHGVNGLVTSVATELAGTGITANALCPGYLDTEMTARSIATIVERTGMTPDEAGAILADMSPAGRLITPAEVSRAALSLCGPDSDAVNGQTVVVNGDGD